MNIKNDDPPSREDPSVLGDPNSAVTPKASVTKAGIEVSPTGAEVGNKLLGIPDDAPEQTSHVDAAENLFERPDQKEEMELDEALTGTTEGIDLFSPVRKALGAGPILIFLLCAALLFLLSQALILVNQLRTLPILA